MRSTRIACVVAAVMAFALIATASASATSFTAAQYPASVVGSNVGLEQVTITIGEKETGATITCREVELLSRQPEFLQAASEAISTQLHLRECSVPIWGNVEYTRGQCLYHIATAGSLYLFTHLIGETEGSCNSGTSPMKLRYATGCEVTFTENSAQLSWMEIAYKNNSDGTVEATANEPVHFATYSSACKASGNVQLKFKVKLWGLTEGGAFDSLQVL